MNPTILTWHAVLLAPILAGMPISTNAQPIDNFGQSTGAMQYWYVGADLGVMQIQTSQDSMTVPNGSNYSPPANVDQYSLNQPQSTMLDIQIGHRWSRDKPWLPSYALALRYQHVFTTNIDGTVTQYSNPEFTNYCYTWGMSADVISLYSKLDLMRYGRWMPYIDLGLGVSFNQSHAYNETALPNVMPRDNPNYASNTTQQFAYNMGVGLDFRMTTKLLLSVGYSYQSFGNLSSGDGQAANWNNTQLQLGKFYSNMGFIGIAYLF